MKLKNKSKPNCCLPLFVQQYVYLFRHRIKKFNTERRFSSIRYLLAASLLPTLTSTKYIHWINSQIFLQNIITKYTTLVLFAYNKKKLFVYSLWHKTVCMLFGLWIVVCEFMWDTIEQFRGCKHRFSSLDILKILSPRMVILKQDFN